MFIYLWNFRKFPGNIHFHSVIHRYSSNYIYSTIYELIGILIIIIIIIKPEVNDIACIQALHALPGTSQLLTQWAPSYLRMSSACAASAAEAAAKRKEEKYIEFAWNHHFFPIAFETFGPINLVGGPSNLYSHWRPTRDIFLFSTPFRYDPAL